MDRETAEDIKRHFNVVAEGLRSDIRTLAEGLGATNDRLDATNDRLDRIESRIEQEFTEVKTMIRLPAESSIAGFEV